jgi:hypothetical protein
MKTERRKIELEKHYKNLSILAATCGIENADGKKLSNKLRKIENIANKINEDWCNGVIDEITWNNEIYTIEQDVMNLFNRRLKGFFVDSDPRGYALKISDEVTRDHYLFLKRDAGGYGLLAPEI